ncbi:Asp23/Gls24 family envelope stress response protein [Salinibacillus xinjiangensis]|uniref:Asp23/Gls24 family envelope stress response protein n=1 Tax=Salinibacillus xinjiangensis TaxID=1229268 RepID=A0A6G1X6W5_9BACI|nr:Asp23/Gls24 family envelope stress response protein [Salinibacillus xinjiangensis]MRG86548.1 Asp23/Gls24 family envelope stress response protein [Salinibacillus xinjiangensis]
MQENHLLKVSEDTSLGNVEIAPEVIEVIAGIAANEVSGVAQMRGNFASNVTERFGKKNHGKGIKVELTDKGIKIDTFSVLDYGVSIPKVAQQIQDNIRQAIKNMTALEIEEVNVHIVGVQIDKEEDTNLDEA